MFVLALIHTFPFIIFHTWKGDMMSEWRTDVVYWTGTVALLAQGYLTFAGMSPLRNMAYEWFKASHFVAALLFVVFFFFHCNFRLSSWDYFIATSNIYSLCWLHFSLRVWFQRGLGKARIDLMSNGFVRVVVPTRTTWRAGQHYFICFMGIGMHAWTAHPFTVCSLPHKAHYYEAKDSELIFFIRPQGGFTARLAKYAEKHPGSQMTVTLDGTYGGIDMPKLEQCDRMLVLTGGSGAGWALPLIEAFLRRKDCAACCDAPAEMAKDCTVPSMRVILATRDLATRNWSEEAISESIKNSLLGTCPPGLMVEVHYTGGDENAAEPKATGQFLKKLDEPEKAPNAQLISRSGPDSSDSDSESNDGKGQRERFALSLRDFKARPYLLTVVAEECTSVDAATSIGVSVCGR